jgi:hypothetical protein
MRCLVMVRATAESEAEPTPMPSEKLLTEMNRFNEELVAAGVMLAADGLQPSKRGKRVHFADGKREIIDGPFADTKELIAGFWLWKVDSMDEALEWAKRCPAPFEGECEIEIRPLFELEDFGVELTPELREAEARMRAKLAARQA